MIPCYFALECIPTAEGVRVLDVQGGVGGGMRMLAAAYGGQAEARARLRPYLQRLGELAGGKRVLFVHDPFSARPPFPDDFFEWVQRFGAYGPVTDWIPSIQSERENGASQRTPDVEQIGVFLDPLAARLRVKLAYCYAARLDYPPTARGHRSRSHEPMLLLSGYRERARSRPNSVVLPPDEVGTIVFSGASERFPDDLRRNERYPVVNPPLLDRLLEQKWLLPALLEGTGAERLLPRWIPVGMGLRTAAEIREFAEAATAVPGFPTAVLQPSLQSLGPSVRFLDHTGLRALTARQPERRIPLSRLEEALRPRIAHSYE
ncbi:MAG TPA: hypothetical protein VFU47_12470, partial [Armatimonadota bacterium]|nr:hypothetical protein [Armatimonadota bacterium]